VRRVEEKNATRAASALPDDTADAAAAETADQPETEA